jgi:hypothetical protein
MEGTSLEPARRGPITRWLERAPAGAFTAYSVAAAFSTYFAMYAFRKPFAVGTYEGAVEVPGIGHLDHKIVFILAQVLGYCASKFLGIKIVSEMNASRRAWAILACIAVAEAGLVLFGMLPMRAAAIGMLVNGLPLGMIWGLVFGFLEGRRTSDLLGAGLCASFILASGVVKTCGKLVLDTGVPERWMPSVTGLLFFPALALSVWFLAQMPPPSAEDERVRVKRAPMDRQARRAFFRAHALGLVVLVAGYVLLTALRDFRDNFARELWDALGYGDQPSIMTTTEIPVAFGALFFVALMIAVKSNRRALLLTHVLMVAGAVFASVCTLLFQARLLGPAPWMIGVGLGLYVAYVPFNCVLFDRMIAATGSIGTAGFLIYVSDAFGYFGSTLLLLYKNLGKPKLDWLRFFEGFSYVSAGACAVLFAASGAYFWISGRARVGAADPAAAR